MSSTMRPTVTTSVTASELPRVRRTKTSSTMAPKAGATTRTTRGRASSWGTCQGTTNCQ